MEIKQRAIEHGPYQPMYKGTPDGGEKHRSFEVQKISTESHFWWHAVNRSGVNHYGRWGRLRDTGGPFTSQKIEVELDNWQPVSFYRDYGRYGIYSSLGMCYPSTEIQSVAHTHEGAENLAETPAYTLSVYAPEIIADDSVDDYGATAISRVQPTSPVFEGATAVAELMSERKFFAIPGRAGGPSGEYLNYQLGIAPSVAAAQDLRTAIESSEKTIKQLERDSGKLIRRRYYFPDEVESSRTEVSREGHPPPFDIWNSILTPDFDSTLTTVTKRTTKRWFSGAFTYYLPKGGWRRTLAELDSVYGVKPGIDTGWELIPFSFVADYFVNAGDVLSNMNAFASDGLVMPYGYMMITQKVETEYTLRRQCYIDNSLVWRTFRGKVVKTTKQRRRANPFGFGVSDNDLSLRQMSILAALGMSRK